MLFRSGLGRAGELDDVEEHLEGDIRARNLSNLSEISPQIRPDLIETRGRSDLCPAECWSNSTCGISGRRDGPAESGQEQVRGGAG